ncbi:ribonucleoside-diphosphate reductase, adenosylcobalamin-dependent [Candidatus Fervidibacteria bacterium JGI MDM2 SSWTFF-3-K9]
MAGTTELPRETLDWFEGDELRARVFFEKYALQDLDGTPLELTPEEMWERIAKVLSEMEETEEKRREWYEKFRWLLWNFRFIPGGRIMHAVGNPRKVTPFNCFVLPIKDDSLEAIFECAKEMARTYSQGGGVGIDISVLRPAGSPVRNAARTSTGAVSFMELYSMVTGTIGQHGRRGALMITIADNHPDVLAFIDIKNDPERRRVRYANISVRVSDELMEAVQRNGKFELRFDGEYFSIRRTVDAREIWDKLIKNAWAAAEPGTLYWSTIKRYSTSEYNGMEVISTNPCGEEPLPAYGNCNLGNINLSAFVLDEFTDAARVDWESLEKAVRYAVRFLDNVITYAVKEDRLPLPQQKERCAAERRIGIGFTGLGDMLAQLRLKYDTDDALEFVDELFHKIKCWAYDESINLAIERGPFPLFDPEKHLQMGFIRERLPRELQEKIKRHGIRNVCVLTVPPVGSGAAMAGVTSGIEPIFALSYIRRSESLSKGEFKVFHPCVMRYMQKFGIDDERDLPEFFVTAHQIVPEMRVRMQAIIQSHIDQSISSCLTRNNLILTDKGLRYIDTICSEWREGEFVPLKGWKVANENGLVTASDFYFNGVRPVYRVTLEGGYTLEGTGNHRVLTITPDHELIWRRLDELQKGEFVVLRKGLEVWGNLRELSEIYGKPFVAERRTNAHAIRIPRRITKPLARFLGYLLSDGGILSNGNTVTFTQQKGEILEHFCQLSENLFGIKPKLHRDPRGHNLYNAKIHSRTLVRFLEYLGAAYQGAEKRTPLCILSAGREIVKEFIRGLTLDGYVSRFADGNPLITVLCNLSERLVREVQQLLLNFGIESNIVAKPYEMSDFQRSHGRIYRHEKRVLYDLYVTAENAHRFMELIGFAERRKNEEAWQLLRKTRLMRAPLGGVVPVNGRVVGALREAMKRVRSFRLYEQIHSLTQHMRTRKVIERDNLLYALEATQTVATVPPFILDPTYTFKRVKLVVQLPEPQETFDLSVPDGHHYIANGIVSHNTVNLPHDITTQEIERIYFLAWKLGCKGITVYREGSREGVLITEEFAQQKRGRLMPKPRPMVMVGKTYKLRTEMGNVYVTVNADEEGPQEVFVRLGKSGSSAMAFTEAIGRLISLALRAGVSPDAIIDQLSGIKSSSATRQENGTIIFSVPDAVAKALEMFLKGENPPKSSALTEVLLQALTENNETELAVPPIPSIREELPQILQANGARYSGDLCPNCGEPLIHSGGCELCLFCGYSRCQ